MVSVFLRMLGASSTTEIYCPVSLLYVVSKVFEKLVNNRIFNHLEKCDLFFVTVLSDKIAWPFNQSGAT